MNRSVINNLCLASSFLSYNKVQRNRVQRNKVHGSLLRHWYVLYQCVLLVAGKHKLTGEPISKCRRWTNLMVILALIWPTWVSASVATHTPHTTQTTHATHAIRVTPATHTPQASHAAQATYKTQTTHTTSFSRLALTRATKSSSTSAVNIHAVRIWPSPGSIRVVLDLNKPVKYQVYTLNAPYRVVVDLQDAKIQANVAAISLKKTRINKIRIGRPNNKITRLVFDTEEVVKPKSFLLSPNEKYGYRLVIDMESKEKEAILALFDLDQIEKSTSGTVGGTPSAGTGSYVGDARGRINNLPSAKASTKVPCQPGIRGVGRDFIIAIDAGHGGEDPGAIGHLGTREKDITLKIARELKAILNQQRGFRSFLIRDGDYYVDLRTRLQRARAQNADLFISIHADAFTSPRVTGSSVFILSKRGASSEAARWLAEKENRSDLVGGVSLDNKGDVLASVLLDLSQAANEDASLEAASQVLRSLGRVTPLHKRYVERAGFAVLKAPDVPSMLIETGFISNPNSERLLRSDAHKRQLARNIMLGVQQYFAGKPHRIVPMPAPKQAPMPVCKPKIVPGVKAAAVRRNIPKQTKPVVRKSGQTSIKPAITRLNNKTLTNKILSKKTLSNKTLSKKMLNKKITKPNYYIVKRGDTLGGIAAKNKISIAKLKAANKLQKNTVLIQQKLIIPGR